MFLFLDHFTGRLFGVEQIQQRNLDSGALTVKKSGSLPTRLMSRIGSRSRPRPCFPAASLIRGWLFLAALETARREFAAALQFLQEPPEFAPPRKVRSNPTVPAPHVFPFLDTCRVDHQSVSIMREKGLACTNS